MTAPGVSSLWNGARLSSSIENRQSQPPRTLSRCTTAGYHCGFLSQLGSDDSSSSISCALEQRYLVPSSSFACFGGK